MPGRVSAMRFLRNKRVIGGFLAIVLVGMASLAWSGWYLSDVLKDGALTPDHNEAKPDLEVATIDQGQIVLRATTLAKPDGPWTKDGVWGLNWEGGYAQVGRIVDIGSQQVVREFRPLPDTPLIGQAVRLDSFSFPANPLEAFGLPFKNVTFSSALGQFTAWLVDGPRRDTWAIFVHGRNASQREALRVLPTVAMSGFPALVITYRNDAGAPASPDGFLRYGQTEWEDLDGAVQYAVENGADSVILVGYSMGGAIVVNFLYRSPLASRAKGVILDAPMIDFNATVDLGARQKGYPAIVTSWGKLWSGLRFGVDWGALDYLGRAEELAVPILLFHGDADASVPVETSDAFAKARPDLVRYVRVVGATHVRSWNMDSPTYEAAVTGFLRGLTKQ